MDEPGVEPGEVEQEEGGNVAMKKGGTCPAILFQLLSTSARGTGQDNEEEELDECEESRSLTCARLPCQPGRPQGLPNSYLALCNYINGVSNLPLNNYITSLL